MMYVSAFAYAKASIHLTTPYFVPDAQMLDALRHAAERGLDVTIILPGTSDSALLSSAGRASYTFLMKSGVKLYERRHDSMLHAKTAVIDHVWSTVGSSNMDPLSFLNNDEVNAVILSPDFADKMEAMFQEDLNQSTQIQIETWNKRPIKEWVKEWFATRVSGWL
jgi:cardiolipin synthase